MSVRTPLRPSRILEALGSSRFATDLRYLGVVGSTSDLLLGAAERGAPDGTVIVAEGQTKGRGQRGTAWDSPTGKGLWFSVLLRPAPAAAALPLLATASGLAVADAIEDAGLEPRLKWPNDVLVERKKVAGILVDLQTPPEEEALAVIGIGVNANQEAGELPEQPALPAESLGRLLGRLVDREQLLAAILRALEARLAVLEQDDVSSLVTAWKSRDALVGCHARVREGERLHEGEVVATDPLEGVSLRDEKGALLTLRAAHARIHSFTWPDA